MKLKSIYYLLALFTCMVILYGCSHKKVAQPAPVKPAIIAKPCPIVIEAPEVKEEFQLYYIGTWQADKDCLWNISINVVMGI